MTIEDIFRRGEIAVRTRNLCFKNDIKTFSDLELHYKLDGGFMNLRFCGRGANDELMRVYNKYKDVDSEEGRVKPAAINKIEEKLKGVVTDLDDVFKSTLVADAYLDDIGQGIDKHLNKQATQKRVISEGLDRKAAQKRVNSKNLKELEKKLKEHWSSVREDEAKQKRDMALAAKPIVAVADVVDFDEIEQTIKKYRRKQARK